MFTAALSMARACLAMIVLFTLLLGVGYPLLVTGIAQAALPFQANGSLLKNASGQIIGSALLGQGFSKPEYLHPRPSAAGDKGYDATASSGSNLGPMDPKLADRVAGDAKALNAEANGPIPVDAVTTSGSGLDPDISPENALRQAPRIAAARRMPLNDLRALIVSSTKSRTLLILGEPRVNVLMVNRLLDQRYAIGRGP
jgi:K+-transporting ATPase ATPase C chain